MIYEAVEPRLLALCESELRARLGGECDVSDYFPDELSESIRAAYVAERVEIRRTDRELYIGNILVESRALESMAKDSEYCFFLICTLGLGVDRLISKCAVTSPTRAFVLDALADAYIEALCDKAENSIAGEGTRHVRLSPGYGDIDLSLGAMIIKSLDAERTLGIKLSESGLMIPKKTVSAIVFVKG